MSAAGIWCFLWWLSPIPANDAEHPRYTISWIFHICEYGSLCLRFVLLKLLEMAQSSRIRKALLGEPFPSYLWDGGRAEKRTAGWFAFRVEDNNNCLKQIHFVTVFRRYEVLWLRLSVGRLASESIYIQYLLYSHCKILKAPILAMIPILSQTLGIGLSAGSVFQGFCMFTVCLADSIHLEKNLNTHFVYFRLLHLARLKVASLRTCCRQACSTTQEAPAETPILQTSIRAYT